MKRLICTILALALLCSAAFAYSDTAQHSASAAIDRWSECGIFCGFAGEFRPDDAITRGEFAVILNRLMQYQNVSTDAFDDLGDAYYRDAVLALHAAGVMQGYARMARPIDTVTEAEAQLMVQRALGRTALSNPSDAPLTRAGAALLLDRCVAAVITAGRVFDRSTDGLCVINGKNTRIHDCTLGDVLVTENGRGALLRNVTVTGTLTVLGVAPSTVTLQSSSVANIVAQPAAVYTVPMAEKVTEVTQPQENDVQPSTPPRIETTLTDGMQAESAFSFTAAAYDQSGARIDCNVRIDGALQAPLSSDEQTATYLFDPSVPGEVVVELSAQDARGQAYSRAFTVLFAPLNAGEATIAVEAFTVCGGYLIAPQTIPLIEGETVAETLIRLLEEHALSYSNSGSPTSDFYLSAIEDFSERDFAVSDTLAEMMEARGFDLTARADTLQSLGEMMFAPTSGWMYCINGTFPVESMSDLILADGDVMRVQFTLAEGCDIGGAPFGFFEAVNRDALTTLIAARPVDAVTPWMDLITKVDLTQEELDALLAELG